LTEKIKSSLCEELTAHYKEIYKLPPLSAKVFSFFLVDSENQEYSFDELVEKFQVSKSSMSSTLHLLSQYDFISQINKIGDRKTYYKITPQHLSMRLKRIKKNLEQEKILTQKLVQFHSIENANMNTTSIEKVNIYTSHLEHSIKSLTETIQKIEELNHTI
jgi:DNA-binding transcriptional regulator GbsR (MarR family)